MSQYWLSPQTVMDRREKTKRNYYTFFSIGLTCSNWSFSINRSAVHFFILCEKKIGKKWKIKLVCLVISSFFPKHIFLFPLPAQWCMKKKPSSEWIHALVALCLATVCTNLEYQCFLLVCLMLVITFTANYIIMTKTIVKWYFFVLSPFHSTEWPILLH